MAAFFKYNYFFFTYFLYAKKQIIVTPCIGVYYVGKDAKLPYRFGLKDFD